SSRAGRPAEIVEQQELLLAGQPFDPARGGLPERDEGRAPDLADDRVRLTDRSLFMRLEPFAGRLLEPPRDARIAQSLAIAYQRARRGPVQTEAVDPFVLLGSRDRGPEREDRRVVDRFRRHLPTACQERAHAVRLPDMVGAVEPFAKPRIEVGLQAASDLLRGPDRHAALRERR